MPTILVTGGAGYIGSHFVMQALSEGFSVVVLDNLSKGHSWAVPKQAQFYEGNIADSAFVRQIIQENQIEALVHFAASIEVGESQINPAKYFQNNVAASLGLFQALVETGVKKVIFSSTAAVYGLPKTVPITEDIELKPINNYGLSKLMMEQILESYHHAYGLDVIRFRYFNAAGAHPEGKIGELHDPESHLIPIVLQTALGKRPSIKIYGDQYPTPDGTCIRDYIHVMDLAKSHLMGLKHLFQNQGVCEAINLGTKSGNSVREVIELCQKVTGREIPAEITDVRPGDPAILVADNTKAMQLLGWQPGYSLEQIIQDAWRWHQNLEKADFIAGFDF